MKLSFVLPGRTSSPVGGFKVVYEYANLLVARGHSVSVVHPYNCDGVSGLRERLSARWWALRLRLRRGEIAPWFELDPRVELPLPASLRADELPPAEAMIATAWQTAPWVAEACAGERGPRGFYLIQHVEAWDEEEVVMATWRLPLHKIVIAHWLEDIAIGIGEGERTSWVPNGLDFESFGVDVPPEQREPRVGVLLSRYKSLEDAIAALQGARAELPELAASAYGTGLRPEDLPEWVEYTRLPSPEALRALYNSCSIFLQASRTEGWGLPATEAMACGCALVTYDNGGSREYAIDGETASVVAEHDPSLLAAAIVELVRDPELRLQRARRGRELVETFTWPRAAASLEAVLEGER